MFVKACIMRLCIMANRKTCFFFSLFVPQGSHIRVLQAKSSIFPSLSVFYSTHGLISVIERSVLTGYLAVCLRELRKLKIWRQLGRISWHVSLTRKRNVLFFRSWCFCKSSKTLQLKRWKHVLLVQLKIQPSYETNI